MSAAMVRLHRWDEIALEKVTEMLSRKIVTGEREMLAQIYLKRGAIVYAYANNHYAGHAPATIKQFQQLWQAKGLPELSRPPKIKQENSLFQD